MPRVAHLSAVHHAEDPRVFHRACTTLADAGFETHLLLPHGQSGQRGGVRVHALPRAEGRYRRLALWPHVFRRAREIDADVYHFHGPELIPVAYLLKRVTGARVVYDMHEDFRAGRGLEGRLLRALERWCFQWVDHVVISDASYAGIVSGSPAPVTLVANYLRPPEHDARLSEPAAAPPPFRLVYTGVLSAERGLLDLLDLAATFREAGCDWRLDVAGVCYRKADRRRAEQQFASQNLDAVVERTAWDEHVPWSVLMRRTARAHVGLALLHPHPNAEQVIPTKFYEYLHCGLPILCSDFPLWRAFIERHGCGATVPPGDPEAAFAVLRHWANTPGQYRELAENARAAAPRYEWPAMGRRLVRLYHHLLGTREPPPDALPAGSEATG